MGQFIPDYHLGMGMSELEKATRYARECAERLMKPKEEEDMNCTTEIGNRKHVEKHHTAYIVKLTHEEWQANPNPNAIDIVIAELGKSDMQWDRQWENLESWGRGGGYQAVVKVFA